MSIFTGLQHAAKPSMPVRSRLPQRPIRLPSRSKRLTRCREFSAISSSPFITCMSMWLQQPYCCSMIFFAPVRSRLKRQISSVARMLLPVPTARNTCLSLTNRPAASDFESLILSKSAIVSRLPSRSYEAILPCPATYTVPSWQAWIILGCGPSSGIGHSALTEPSELITRMA